MDSLSYVNKISTGLFYIVISIWWMIQLSKRYWYSKHSRLEFTSSVTYPCCNRCHHCSVEGALKLTASLILVVVDSYSLIYSPTTELETLRHYQSIAQVTVFIIFSASGFVDILYQCNKRLVFPNLDYIVLLLAFTAQSLVSSYDVGDNSSWADITDSLMMFSAFGAALAVLLELKQNDFIWFAILRALFTLVLGTWMINATFILTSNTSNNETSTVADEKSATKGAMNHMMTANMHMNKSALRMEDMDWDNSPSLVLAMMYSWHCLADVIALGIIWLITHRFVSRNKCCCIPIDKEISGRFENRVHFDYHFLARLDSDLD
ncbi:hypothetical protein ACJMK2_011214 [Sinanodonta woodiana]|uniref:Transmembrane protein 45B n=1 Tax=Sinanodonta woodiana TaxID=1069815 RepID=A0ABD3V6S2_SINWO